MLFFDFACFSLQQRYSFDTVHTAEDKEKKMITERDSIGSEPTQNGPLQPSEHSDEATDRPVVELGTNSTNGASHARDTAGGSETKSSSSLSPATGMAPETKDGHVLQRASSAPSSLENVASTLLSQEVQEELKTTSLHPVAEGKSMSHVPYNNNQIENTPRTIQASPVKVGGHVSNEAFEEFINSPRGQNAIVERSPGCRYVRFMEKLGSGASKDVYRAYDTTEGIEVAWNVVQLSGVPKAERNRIVNEVRLLERLHHPNIIIFHGSWVNRERQEVNFVTEILSSGTLTSFNEKVQVIRWKIAKRWAFQILKGLEYLHGQEPPVIHRDLKCENIFINGTSGDLRIGDLGLSTVHRNGKVLSVLGTPEFMAPDLYEESAYDEKVDIYAFGMCLLEILTKEIPYRECSNPAQIYKKVMNGVKPESLSRLRSKMARDFVVLCLGEKDPVTGKYVRPSVTELLTNQFLAKSANDDDEVIVDPPLHRRTIFEDPISHVTGSGNDFTVEEQVPLPASRRKDETTAEDDSDKFEEMPDSETNMRKVKVFMGRNEEFKEENHVVAQQPPPIQPIQSDTPQQPVADNGHATSQATLSGQQMGGSVPIDDLSNASQQGQQFLVAATVIEDQAAAMPHYQDDILKLIITLPVHGQTQNVQFSFHLVEDDPVEVAREMVAELGIPQEAVLEIGGIISALARQARMKQGQYRRQQIQAQGVQGIASQTGPGALAQEPQAAQQVHQPQNSAQGSQPLQVGANAAVQGQVSAVGSASTQLSIPRLPSQPIAHANVQPVPQPPATVGDQVQVLQQHSNPPSSNVSPANQQVPRKTGVPPDFLSPMSDLASQELATYAHVVENQTGRAVDAALDETDDEGKESVKEELRLLDEEFQKNVVRARKVFDSRMDNLQRSKQEKEEQHKKTLQKHEKEKIEFEKRLQQEKKEQSERLEKMQREWEIQRQILERDDDHLQQNANQGSGIRSLSSSPPSQECISSESQQREG